ncbi:MAG: PepSY domain-containing protein [Oscillospiraceae bacterium]|nr:PepSY domain-containing protein [Oscillospiraceae bacterium]
MKKTRLFGIAATAVIAASAVLPTATVFAASAPRVEKTTYEGKGLVDVDFLGDVHYKNAKVTVKDASGKKYTTQITHRDDDDLEFRIQNYQTGKTYTYQISGVGALHSNTYTTVSGKVTIPASSSKKVSVKKVTYEGGGKVEVDFLKDVRYSNAKVTVKDSAGKTYAATILDRDEDSLEFGIKNYQAGKTYRFTISGLRTAGVSTAQSATGSVTIPAKASNISLAKAKSIALTHAKLKASQVVFTEAKPDYDDGVKVYEIEFHRGNWEYSYTIKASNGKILAHEKEYD